MKLTARISAAGVRRKFGALADIVRGPFAGGRGQIVLDRVRKLSAEEFSRGAGFISGAWDPTKEFGSRPATVPPLGGAGSALAQAWQGGPGGFSSISDGVVRWGVALPYAQIQRQGGSIGVTPKMRVFVGVTFGVWFSPEKTSIKIPARPHVDISAPQYVNAARGVVVEAITQAGAA